MILSVTMSYFDYSRRFKKCIFTNVEAKLGRLVERFETMFLVNSELPNVILSCFCSFSILVVKFNFNRLEFVVSQTLNF